jgi:hypothetical protein
VKGERMKRINSLMFLIVIISGCLFAEQKYDGIWSDEARYSPTNPSSFVCIEKLSDGRFFIISNHTDNNDNPVWEVAFGIVKNGTMYTKLSDGQWKLKYWINNQNIEYITMESIENPDISIGMGRVSEQPINKLEGTVRKEKFAK